LRVPAVGRGAARTVLGVEQTMDDVVIRPTELEALANVQTVLQLCSAGKIKCSEKTARPSAATRCRLR
jgi:hypothetical protein